MQLKQHSQDLVLSFIKINIQENDSLTVKYFSRQNKFNYGNTGELTCIHLQLLKTSLPLQL